jgi:competence ComEA-like helix-hairpin-helix protein
VQDTTQPEETDKDMSAWIEDLPEAIEPEAEVEEPATDEPSAEPDFDDADEAIAWLESLAAKQGVSEDELLTSPEERSETPAEWAKSDIETEKAAKEVIEKAEETEYAEPPVEQNVQDEVTTAVDNGVSIAPPSWISDGQVPEDEVISWLPETEEEESQLLDLNQASLIQLERLPGIGFRRAQSITAYREEYGDFTNLESLLNVPGMDQDTFELLKARVTITAPEREPKPDITPDLSLFAPQETEPDDLVHKMQLTAQTKLNESNIGEAMESYKEIINKGQRLNEIIDDLNKAVEKFPSELSIMQTLGDAYMQANMLQEALEAYTKAENLLQ